MRKWTEKDIHKVFSTKKVTTQVLHHIPKDYHAKRIVLDRDAEVFKVSVEKLAEMYISDFKEIDESFGIRRNYVIVKLPANLATHGQTAFVYESDDFERV